jgi:hypothetical protein
MYVRSPLRYRRNINLRSQSDPIKQGWSIYIARGNEYSSLFQSWKNMENIEKMSCKRLDLVVSLGTIETSTKDRCHQTLFGNHLSIRQTTSSTKTLVTLSNNRFFSGVGKTVSLKQDILIDEFNIPF